MSVHAADNSVKFLKAESELTLQKVQKALGSYLEDPEDIGLLGPMADLSDQIRGVFVMLDRPDAALFMEEVKRLTRGLEQGEVTDPETAREILSQAILQASRYLNWLDWDGDKPDFDLSPLINQLRIARGAPLDAGISKEAAAEPALGALRNLALHLRPSLQRALLSVLRGRSRTESLSQIAKIFSQFKKVAPDETIYHFWWLAEGFALSVQNSEIAPNQKVNLLLRDLDRQVKLLTETNDINYRDDVIAQDVSQRISDYLSTSSEGSARLKQRLDYSPPSPSHPVLAGSTMDSGPSLLDLDTLLKITAHIRESIALIKDAIDRFARDGNHHTDILKAQMGRMHALVNVLMLLNMPISAELIRRHLDIFKQWIASEVSVTDEQVIELASELILVEDSLDGVSDFAYNQEMADAVAAGLDNAGKIDLLLDYQHKQSRRIIIQESLDLMKRVRDFVSTQMEQSGVSAIWNELPPLLHHVRGVYAILDCGDAVTVMERLHNIVQALANGAKVENYSLFTSTFAEIVVAMEKYLEQLAGVKRPAQESLTHIEQQISIVEGLFDTSSPAATLANDTSKFDSAEHEAIKEAAPDTTIPSADSLSPDLPSADLSSIDSTIDSFSEPLEVAHFALEKASPRLQNLQTEKTPNGEFEAELPQDLKLESEPQLDSELNQHPDPDSDLELELGTELLDHPELGAEISEPEQDHIREETQDEIVAPPPQTSAIASTTIPHDVDPEFLEIFFEEAEGEVASICEQLALWRENLADLDALTSIRRSFHTLKGSGRMVGATVIGEFAWAFEQMLNRVLDGTLTVSPQITDAVDDAQRLIAPAIANAREPNADEMTTISALMRRVEALVNDEESLSKEELLGAEDTEDNAKISANEEVAIKTPEEHLETEQIIEPTEQKVEPLHDNSEEQTPGVEYIPDKTDTKVKAEVSPAEEASKTDDEAAVVETAVETTDTKAAISVPEAPEVVLADLDPELMEVFLYEASEILDGSDFTLQRLSAEPDNEELFNDFRREMHTLKGSSRMAGLAVMGDLAHAVESLLESMVKREAVASSDTMDILQRALDTLSDMLTKVKNGIGIFSAIDLVNELHRMQSLRSNPSEQTAQAQIEQTGESEAAQGEFFTASEFNQNGESTSKNLRDEPSRFAGKVETDRELMDAFLYEASDLLDNSDIILQRWKTDRDNDDLLNDLRRDMHTIKGSSRMVGLPPIGNLAHAVESVLEAIGKRKLEPAAAPVELLQRSLDTLNDMLSLVKGNNDIAPADDLISEFHSLLSLEAIPLQEETKPLKEVSTPAVQPVQRAERKSSLPSGTDTDTIRVNASLMNTLINQMGESSIYRARVDQGVGGVRFNLNELDQTVNRLRQQLRRLEIETEAQILFRYEEGPKHGHIDDFDPLELDRFSELQQLSRQLMEVVEDLTNIQNSLEDQAHNMSFLLDQQAKVNKEVQQGLMQTRMVRFSSIVPRLRRVVRQVAQDVGKRAELVISGSESEVDRSVLENMVAPLEHMLRNAIFHGIEPPEKRRDKGKSETGNITLDLRREGAELVLKLSDDGAGLDFKAIRAKAEERGDIKPGQEVSEQDLISLILKPGFSVAKNVSLVAGRGVGMDVLNDAIKAMRGALHIQSEENIGSTFTIRLPFSLAVTQALLVEAGGDTYAVPLLSVEAVTRLSEGELPSYLSGNTVYHTYNENRYQMHSLGVLFGNEAAVRNIEDVTDMRPPSLLFRSAEASAALQVDAVLGNQEIIVKPVGPQLHTVPGISGATVLGDGRVIVVLELAALVRNLNSKAQQQAEERTLRAAQREAEQEHITAMVIDDSITMRKVMARFLERHGISVTVAKDGVEAIALLEEHLPDLAFLDIEMPRMDGFEVMGHIRNQPHLKQLPVIMVTSRSGEKHRERGARLGVNDYLIKPYQEEEMLKSIRKVLAERGLELPS